MLCFDFKWICYMEITLFTSWNCSSDQQKMVSGIEWRIVCCSLCRWTRSVEPRKKKKTNPITHKGSKTVIHAIIWHRIDHDHDILSVNLKNVRQSKMKKKSVLLTNIKRISTTHLILKRNLSSLKSVRLKNRVSTT